MFLLQVLRNANDKINKLKKKLESKDDGKKMQAQLNDLVKQHENEKKVRAYLVNLGI